MFQGTYIRDIKERYNIRNDDDLSELIDIIASNIGCLTNPTNLENTFKSVKGHSISDTTIQSYLGMLQDAFMLEKAIRYDIKGKHYINTPSKYYFEDVGLRNARLNYRQIDGGHLMENIIYNELRIRGYSIDVGQVEGINVCTYNQHLICPLKKKLTRKPIPFVISKMDSLK